MQAIDCTHEVSRVLQSVDPDRCWLASEIRDEDWLVPLSAEITSELDALAEFIEQNPVNDLQRSVKDYRLPAVRRAVDMLKRHLVNGVGFGVLDHLDVARYSTEVLVQIYWLIGQLIGRPVAQKWSGQMVYDVRDTGQAYEYGVRGSHTTVELVFHADNAFGLAMPEFVGLLCRKPAKSGGISRFCSMYTLHQRIAEGYPDALARLYQPMLFDRQKEHAEGAPALCRAPFFSVVDGDLRARANTSLVHKAYKLAAEPMDTPLADALDVVDELSGSEDLWFEAALQQGQIQYLNNRSTAHYRSEFVDHENLDDKRHLFRLWHREQGATCYDGVSM